MELSDLYSQKILEIAANIPSAPRLACPHGTARKVSRVCGSAIEVDLMVENGIVTQFGQVVSACAMGQTSAAIMASHVVGSSASELRALAQAMHAMLKAEGDAPQGKWQDLQYLMPVRDYRHRHASTLLVFDAVVAALDQAGA